MSFFSEAKKFVVIKLETTPGTAETLASADHNLRAFDVSADPQIEMWTNQYASGRHSKAGGVMGKAKMTVGFKHALNLGASAAVAPLLAKAFQACGLLETVVAVTSVAYTPNATKDDGVSATISLWLVPPSGSAVEVKMKGAMGTVVISMDDLGHPLVAQFTFTGAFVGISDQTVLALTSPDTSIPPAILGVAITAASTAQKIGKLSLDVGNDVQLDYDPAEATGYKMAYIAKRDPKLMLDPKAELLATNAIYTRWRAGTEFAVSVVSATVGGLKWTLSIPVAQIKANKLANRNGETTYDQELELHESAGNDEFSLKQSA